MTGSLPKSSMFTRREPTRLPCSARCIIRTEDNATLAARIARLLALAHQTLTQKTGQEAANGTEPFDVWLCAKGQTGGEQWRSNLYLYDIDTPRSSIEWIREIVHEYSPSRPAGHRRLRRARILGERLPRANADRALVHAPARRPGPRSKPSGATSAARPTLTACCWPRPWRSTKRSAPARRGWRAKTRPECVI